MIVVTEFELDVSGIDEDVIVWGHTVKAVATIERDIYGQDADGNRGEYRYEIADIEIMVFSLGGDNVTKKAHEIDQVWKRVEEQAEDAVWRNFDKQTSGYWEAA